MQFRLATPQRIDARGSARAFGQRLIRAASRAVDEASRGSLRDIRSNMAGQRLGRLGNALGSGSDRAKGRISVERSGTLSTSGWVHIRSKSERAVGAIISYTEGSAISPKAGRRWLAFATDEIPRRAGRYKMTPELYERSGLDKRIGELEFIPGKSPGEAFLIARNVTVQAARGFGKARRLPKSGNVRAGRVARDFIVAFILIRRTARARRVDANAIIRRWHDRVPRLISKYLEARRASSPVIMSSSGRFTA